MKNGQRLDLTPPLLLINHQIGREAVQDCWDKDVFTFYVYDMYGSPMARIKKQESRNFYAIRKIQMKISVSLMVSKI